LKLIAEEKTTNTPMLAEVYPQFAERVFGAVIPERPNNEIL
jgi:hypothetical protein